VVSQAGSSGNRLRTLDSSASTPVYDQDIAFTTSGANAGQPTAIPTADANGDEGWEVGPQSLRPTRFRANPVAATSCGGEIAIRALARHRQVHVQRQRRQRSELQRAGP
jgi:hypothetical protein